jgi:excisionase family DNA binding protein
MSTASTGLSDWEKSPILGPKWAGRDTLTVPEAAEILRLSRWSAYQAVKRGEIPVIWFGRRCLVPRRALEKLLSLGA